jgi:hypothetical protein
MTGSYGTNNKKVVFTDTDHRHAQLLICLNHDGLKQSEFFRAIITGYINSDTRIQDYIDEVSTQSKKKKKKSKQLRTTGGTVTSDLGLQNSEIESIFDLIEEEHPEL